MMTRTEIMRILPHREPFLLIDEIGNMEPGKYCEAVWNITGKEYFFTGHFPEYPVVPGVLIVEALAQTGAVAVLSMPEFAGKLGLLAGVDGFRFKRQVVPGDFLNLTVHIEKIRLGMGVGSGKAMVNGKIAASGKILFAISDGGLSL